MSLDLHSVLKASFVQALIRRVCGEKPEIIERPASFALRRPHEGERDIERIIILPPQGYTANTINQTNSHDEAESATIEIKGGVRSGRHGFSKLKKCLLVASLPEKGRVSDLNKPYLTFDLEADNIPDLSRDFHSAGEPPFPVVKKDGFGFYHNLINVTDDWLVLKLHKKLRPQRHVDLAPRLASLPAHEADALSRLYDGIVAHGDGVFSSEAGLIEEVSALPPDHTLPALGEMLYAHDTGRHEACTAFAIILKIGKREPAKVTDFLRETLKMKSVPAYYAQQLIEKIRRAQGRAANQNQPDNGLRQDSLD